MKTVVRSFLFNPEWKILLVKHKKESPWVLPGWHVENGESLHEAMHRELKEELSLKGNFFEIDNEEVLHHKWKKLKHFPLPISIYSLEYKDSNWVDKSRLEHIFLMETEDTIKETQKEEICLYQWFEVDEILTMKPNIEIWDFTIEMLEKIVGEEGEEGEE